MDHVPEGVHGPPVFHIAVDQAFDLADFVLQGRLLGEQIVVQLDVGLQASQGIGFPLDIVFLVGDELEEEQVVEQQDEESRRGGGDQQEPRQRRPFRLALFRREQVDSNHGSVSTHP